MTVEDAEALLRELIKLDRQIAQARDRLKSLELARVGIASALKRALGQRGAGDGVDLWER